ncbi:hypothetical protein HDV00_008817 [Rhizophlyctis rosea]|nr:hypothetical protein HDV00_008817 [Rhizophlyctis rosea]
MKHHFDFHAWPGIQYPDLDSSSSPSERERVETVRELEEALRELKTKLAAAYARIRIERRASGESAQEWMERILPEEVRVKEEIAAEMPNHARVNALRSTTEGVAQTLIGMGYPVELRQRSTRPEGEDPVIRLDENFEDVFVIPSQFCNDIKNSKLVEDGRLVFQDKASLWATQHLAGQLTGTIEIIDARAGCGTKTSQLSSLMRNKGRIYTFEDRPSRLEALKSHLKVQGCQNVELIESDFLTSDPSDPKFANVTVIVLEPPNSGTAILDKLNYLLQEEEFPNESYSQKDLFSLKNRQAALLKHAFSFPNVETVVYVTRSVHSEENEQVVEEALDRLAGVWELACVSPEVAIPRTADYEFEECLKIPPAQTTGNGIFIASFHKLPPTPPSPSPPPSDIHDEGIQNVNLREQKRRKSRFRRRRESNVNAAIARKRFSDVSDAKPKWAPPPLSKSLSESVARLAAPKGRTSISDATTSRRVSGPTAAAAAEKGVRRRSDDVDPDEQEGDEQTSEIPQKKRGSKAAADDDEGFEIDMAVWGNSLKGFYRPREIAMRSIGADVVVRPRWRYPVPNPVPWK